MWMKVSTPFLIHPTHTFWKCELLHISFSRFFDSSSFFVVQWRKSSQGRANCHSRRLWVGSQTQPTLCHLCVLPPSVLWFLQTTMQYISVITTRPKWSIVIEGIMTREGRVRSSWNLTQFPCFSGLSFPLSHTWGCAQWSGVRLSPVRFWRLSPTTFDFAGE